MPVEYIWHNFLHYMGWLDRRVLDAQPDIEVFINLKVYEAKAKWGLLPKGSVM